MQFRTTGSKQIRSIQCCVVFDPDDGQIQHVHRVVTMDGANDTSEQEMESRTLHLAREFGLNVKKLRIMHVDSHDLLPGRQYSVDPASRKLVSRPINRS
jgi:hypothetical protein